MAGCNSPVNWWLVQENLTVQGVLGFHVRVYRKALLGLELQVRPRHAVRGDDEHARWYSWVCLGWSRCWSTSDWLGTCGARTISNVSEVYRTVRRKFGLYYR
jgi:hypothetical protein